MINLKYRMLNFILLLMILLIYVNTEEISIQNQKVTYYSVGDTISGHSSGANDGKGYYIVQINSLDKKYLFLELITNDEGKFIDMTMQVNRGIEKTPFKVCKHDQIDSCYIFNQSLQKNSQIMITVRCQQSCDYNLKTYWSDLQYLRPGSINKFIFSQDHTQIYHLQLNQKEQFHEVRIIMKPQTKGEMFDMIKIYGKFGHHAAPTATDYDFKSIHLWQDAQGVYLFKRELKDHNMTILIVGEGKTVYSLICDLINQTSHEIKPGHIFDEYLEPKQIAFYHLSFAPNNNVQFQQYAFKFSAFNGNLSIGFYTDPEHKNPYMIQPYEYMSDAQFIFTKEHTETNLTQGLYIRVQSSDRISTYTMMLIGRGKQQFIEIKDHIYQFTEVQPQKPRFIYFNHFIFQDQYQYTDKFSFTVNLINVNGSHGITFRVCDKDIFNNLTPQNYLNFTKEIESDRFDEIGTKKVFRLDVPREMLISVHTAIEQKLTVIAIISSLEKSPSIFALEYYQDSTFQILRQSRPIESRLKMHENKLYKFTNVDKKIKQVRIHFNKISGLVSVVSLRHNPAEKNDGKKETSNVISFTNDLVDTPIFLIVFAEQDSIISLDVQLIHENKDYISSITIQQDVQFKLKIPPQGIEFVEVHPVFNDLYFDFQSTGLTILCQYKDNKCKKEIPDMGVQGTLEMKNFNMKSELIMIQNPSDSKTIQVTLIYHSADYTHCEHRKTGIIYNEIIEDNSCYSFSLEKLKTLQILATRLDIGTFNIQALLCNQLIELALMKQGNLYEINEKVLNKSCQKQQQRALMLILSNGQNKIGQTSNYTQTKLSSDIATIKMKISVQYKDERSIVIPDGVPFQISRIAKEQALQIFYYEVLNKINTTFILTNKIGNAFFTVKLVNTVDRHKYLDKTSSDFSSNSSNYYLNPAVTVPEQFFNSQKALCKTDCSFIIKVFSKQIIGSNNLFMIEVTQNYFTLEEHKMKSDYLIKDAITYFKFFNKQKGNSLLIETSDNNKKCTKIILNDEEYPNEKNNLEIENGNSLIYQNASNKTYFIAVQAIQDCAYEISVSTTKIHITHLQRGKLGYLKLSEGQVKYFILHRMSIIPFKILSIHLYGEINFYLNRTNEKQLAALVKKESINYTAFEVEGQYKNRLIMNSDQGLSENSYYILACAAKKSTDTSIYFGDQDTFLQISQKKQIHDYLLKKGDTLKGYYYDVEDTKIKIKVHNGKLKLKITYYDQKFDKNFEKLDDSYEQQFQMTGIAYDYTPALVEIQALQDETLYALRIISQTTDHYSSTIDETQVTPGEPNYMYFSNQKVSCLRGYLRDQNEEIMITFDNDYQEGINELDIQVSLNGTEINFTKDIVRNIIRIKFNLNNTYFNNKQGKRYGVCFSTEKQSMSATAFQTQSINLIPPDVSTLIQGTKQFVIRPDGNFLIDVYECKGKTNITYSKSLTNLDTASKNSLDILGMPQQPHAFKITQYGTTFLRVSSAMATLRWIPIDEDNQQGLGYIQYQIGQILYDSSGDTFIVKWQGLKSKIKPNTTVKDINYTIYFSNTTELIQSVQNCQLFNNNSVLKYIVRDVNPLALLNQNKHYPIKKSQLTQKYSQIENIYLSIVADVDIQPIKGQLEHYRFFYTKQEIPKQVFMENNEYINKAMTIGLIIAGIVAFLIFTWICTKKIIPLLGRLKNRYLVEQQDPKNKQEGDVPPPSSERKTIQENLGTDDKMTDEIKAPTAPS